MKEAKSSFAKFLAQAILLSLLVSPVPARCAEDNASPDEGSSKRIDEKPADKVEVERPKTSIAKSVAGVIAGLTIGVPVKISQDVRRETVRIAGTLRGDVGNDFGVIENVIVVGGAVPFGLIGGTILGTIRGTEHALTYGSQQPFSKESLSLKPTEQEPDKQY